MHALQRIMNQTERHIVGLMSGTSADGIDVAIVRLCQKAGDRADISVLAFATVPYPEGLQAQIFAVSDPVHGRVDAVCRMHFVLGELFARAALRVVREAGMRVKDIHLIGSHGQTIHHLPARVEAFGVTTGATLQIGDPSVIAQRTGVVTVGDFRPADIARGGQGAPLVPYADYLLFRAPDVSRGLLNIGGIANMTVLPAGARPEAVLAFDTGPGNMVIDAAARALTGQPCDYGGARARRGAASEPVAARMLALPYFALPPPKSTGRELFGQAYCDRLLEEGRRLRLSPNDILATATEITARSIADSYRRFIAPTTPLDEVIVSGGGARNPYLCGRLAALLHPVRVATSDERGLSPDAKEAVAFAVLANQTIMGRPGNLPGATGADRRAVLGKICLP
jgi:anhydro-N-acetylmuramic acid kinase